MKHRQLDSRPSSTPPDQGDPGCCRARRLAVVASLTARSQGVKVSPGSFAGIYRGSIGIMEKKMETTIEYIGGL